MKETLPDTVESDSLSRTPSFFRRGTAAAFFYTSLVLDGALWVAPMVFIGIGDGTVVLRYNAYFGVNLTGSPRQVLLIPLMTTAFFAMNTALAFVFVRKGVPFPAILLMVASFFLHVAALIAISALIVVN